MQKKVVAVLLSTVLAGCASTPVAPVARVAADPAHVQSPDAPGESVPDKVGDAVGEARRDPAGPWIGAAGASDFVLTGTHDTFLGVWVDVPATVKRVHSPVALSLVIDTSGSMAGAKIENARAAARSLVQKLRDGDVIAIDTFSDDARERVPLTVIDARSRARLLGAIAELNASGGTNLFEGLRLGETTVLSAPATHSIRRVVVISDGIATVGATSPEILGALAARGAERGVQVSSIGVGLEYDETTLNALAVRSSGRLYHLSEPREMAAILEREIELLDSTMATEAFVEIVPAPGVRILGVDGVVTTPMGNGLRVPLGTMFGGQHREMMVRVRVTAEGAGSRAIASVRLHFRDPADDNLERVQEIVARHEATVDPLVVERHANAKVRSIAAVQEAAQVAVRAAQQVNAGDFASADKQLAVAEAQIRRSADELSDKREKQRVMATADRMAVARKSAQAAQAAPAAAKPAAMRAGRSK